MQKWEYRTIEVTGTRVNAIDGMSITTGNKDDFELMHQLKNLGEGGWELVMSTTEANRHQLFFKRPK